MLRIQIGMIFAIAFLLLAGCSGCRSVPEPTFLTNAPINYNGYSKAELAKCKGLSEESAKMGWSFLASYFNRNNLIPAFNRSYITDAMECFNYCWNFNNENYQAYWGAGVVRGVQATFTKDETLIEKYLKQSVEFMLLAEKHEVPAAQINNLHLDLANSYNGLGAFYLHVSKKEMADTNLELARTILLDVTKKEPENARAFYLLAVTSFYQNKFEEAKQESDQAQSKYFKVPEDFLKDLSLKNPGSPAIDKR